MEANSEVVSREQCPACAARGNDTSGDNLVVYSDGHSHCFACGYHESPGGSDSGMLGMPVDRNIGLMTEEVLNQYGCRLSSDGKHLLFPYRLKSGGSSFKLTYKQRSIDPDTGKLLRDFRFVNRNSDGIVPLFGSVNKNHSNIIIFEGERDLLTYLSHYELPDDTWGALAIPGCSYAKAAAQYLHDYTGNIYLCFDRDKAGEKATQEFLSIIPCYYNVGFMFNDVAETIENGVAIEFQWHRDLGYCSSLRRAYDEYRNTTLQEPLVELGVFDSMCHPRKGAFFIVAGESGSGKSFFVDYVINKALDNGLKVLLHSLELQVGEVLSRLLNQRSACGDEDAEQEFFDKAEKLLYINECDSTIETLRRQCAALQPDIVVVDTISLFCSSLEWDRLVETSYALKKVALDPKLGKPFVLAVSQMSLKGVSTNKVQLSNLFGAAGIAQAADYVKFIAPCSTIPGATLVKVLKRDRLLGVFDQKKVMFDFECGDYYEVDETTVKEETNDYTDLEF